MAVYLCASAPDTRILINSYVLTIHWPVQTLTFKACGFCGSELFTIETLVRNVNQSPFD
jgi:hypothetical protein